MNNLTMLTEPRVRFFDANSQQLGGGLVYTYLAGTSTPVTTYTDSSGTTPNTNPVVLDALGEASIWYFGSIKVNVTDSLGAQQPGYPMDNITDLNSFISTNVQWVSTTLVPTYVSGISFSLVGAQTADFHVARRLKLICSAGTVYGNIIGSTYSGGLTTVTLSMDPGNANLDAGLSTVFLSFLSYLNPSLRKVPIIDHGTMNGNYTLQLSDADVHIIEFSANATLTLTSALTSDKSTIIIKNGNHTITLAGIDNNSPTLTVAASKQDFITLAKSFGKITCISQVLNEATT